MPLLNQTQYAERRNVSKMAVSKWVRDGKIPTVGKLIDPEAADAALARNNRVNISAAKTAARPEVRTVPTAGKRTPQQERGPTPGTLAHAQLVKETAQAKKAAIEAQRLEQKYVDIDAIKRVAVSLVTTAKSRLRGVGAKLAPELAVQPEPAVCQALVDAEIDEALAELSRWEPSAA